jgi:hypothetical protein
MLYTPWVVSICRSANDLQMLWRVFGAVSSVPLRMTLFVALSGCLLIRRHQWWYSTGARA